MRLSAERHGSARKAKRSHKFMISEICSSDVPTELSARRHGNARDLMRSKSVVERFQSLSNVTAGHFGIDASKGWRVGSEQYQSPGASALSRAPACETVQVVPVRAAIASPFLSKARLSPFRICKRPLGHHQICAQLPVAITPPLHEPHGLQAAGSTLFYTRLNKNRGMCVR